MFTHFTRLLYPISGSQIGQSEAPEVGGIWPEVGGKPLPMLLFLLLNSIEYSTILFKKFNVVFNTYIYILL